MKFENLPRPLRASAWALGGVRNCIFRYGPEYFRFRKFLKSSSDWDAHRADAWASEQLEALIKEAKHGCEYYRRSLDGHEPALTSGTTTDDVLQNLPLVRKDTLKSLTSQFNNRSRIGLIRHSTSGTTGSPLTVSLDWSSIQRRQAIFDDHVQHCGVPPQGRSIRLSGRYLAPLNQSASKPWLFNPAENQLFLSTYHLAGQTAKMIADKVREFKPLRIDGYPSAIRELLRILEKTGGVPRSLKLIITTAETLAIEMRQEIAEISGALVCDYYSASEGLPYIQQCAVGTYHVRWQTGTFELLDDKGRVGRAGDGVAVATSFAQRKTPLIRYVTGDYLSGLDKAHSGCECGWGTPTIKAVQGRLEDLVLTPDGRRLGMFTYRTLKHISGLVEAQVIQKEVNSFMVRAVLEPGLNQSALQQSISEQFSRAIGEQAIVELDIVESLPRGANGKVRLVISEIN